MMRTPKAGQTFGVFHMQNLLNGQGLHKPKSVIRHAVSVSDWEK